MDIAYQKSTPRDFFLYLLAIITLYISVWRFVDLIFEYINFLFPDNLNHDWFWSAAAYSVIRIDMAALIVVFPVYLGLTWFLRKDAIAHSEKREMRVRKWLLNFTLFLTAVTIIVDLVTLINAFLEGELTARFLLKVLTVFLVAGSVFAYYFWDLRRETLPSSKPSKLIVVFAGLVVVLSIVAGFFIIGSPMTQRARRFDEQRVNELQSLQGQIVFFWQQKSSLPSALDGLKDNISGFVPPIDPQTGAAYEYKVKDALSFELCANFNLPALREALSANQKPLPLIEYHSPYGENWDHAAGRVCFERNIDPQLYRPQKPFPFSQ